MQCKLDVGVFKALVEQIPGRNFEIPHWHSFTSQNKDMSGQKPYQTTVGLTPLVLFYFWANIYWSDYFYANITVCPSPACVTTRQKKIISSNPKMFKALK